MNLRLSAARLHEAMERSGGVYRHFRDAVILLLLGAMLWLRYIRLR